MPLRRMAGVTAVGMVAVVMAMTLVAAAGRMMRAVAFPDYDDAVVDPDALTWASCQVVGG
jgi:hypothetical protein